MKQEHPTGKKGRKADSEEKEAAEKLSKPPEDKREVTIAPGKGPDVTIE